MNHSTSNFAKELNPAKFKSATHDSSKMVILNQIAIHELRIGPALASAYGATKSKHCRCQESKNRH